MTKPKNEHGTDLTMSEAHRAAWRALWEGDALKAMAADLGPAALHDEVELTIADEAIERAHRQSLLRRFVDSPDVRASLAELRAPVEPFTLPDAPGLPDPELSTGAVFIGDADDLRRVMTAAYRAAAGWSEDSPPFVKADVSPPRLPDRPPLSRAAAWMVATGAVDLSDCPPDASEEPQTPADPPEAPEALTGATAGERVTTWLAFGESAQSSLRPHPDAAMTAHSTFMGKVHRDDTRPRLWPSSDAERAAELWNEAHRYDPAPVTIVDESSLLSADEARVACVEAFDDDHAAMEAAAIDNMRYWTANPSLGNLGETLAPPMNLDDMTRAAVGDEIMRYADECSEDVRQKANAALDNIMRTFGAVPRSSVVTEPSPSLANAEAVRAVFRKNLPVYMALGFSTDDMSRMAFGEPKTPDMANMRKLEPICDACGDDPTEWPCVNCHRGIGG